MMLESLMVILTLVGLFLVVLGFTSIETGEGAVGGILLLVGGMLFWGRGFRPVSRLLSSRRFRDT